MKIGELAKATGLTASRIRFYESSGLIGVVRRLPNGYRDYSVDAVWILEIITTAQKAGFSLEEIRRLLPSGTKGWDHGDLVDMLQFKVNEISQLQERLKKNKAMLRSAITGIKNRPMNMDCAERTAWILKRLRKSGIFAEGE